MEGASDEGREFVGFFGGEEEESSKPRGRERERETEGGIDCEQSNPLVRSTT